MPDDSTRCSRTMPGADGHGSVCRYAGGTARRLDGGAG